ncbi:MAG TPA: SMP-30/gluconolactonase/LRE family protein [Polyangiales bacterium]|nr:SMP-30/gluconolactonase/LRE family protein [Polyangiales bacterium]
MPDAASDDAGAPAGCSDCCPDGFARGTAAAASRLRQLAAFTPSPADVATCPDGSVFVTLDGPDQVWRIPESGPPVAYADVTGVQPAGIACDERGRLFVIAFSLRANSPFKTPGVLLVEGELAAPRLLPQPRGGSFTTPNGIAAASGIGLYATDTLGGAVVLIREVNGTFESTIAARNMLGVNGVAYDGAARKLYVSNSVSQEVTSFAVSADGALSKPSVEWTATGFEQLDGMVVDELGRAYVAGWGGGDVHRLSDQKVVASVAKPASLAFRGGTLLVVDYHLGEPTREGGLYAVDLGACGAR